METELTLENLPNYAKDALNTVAKNEGFIKYALDVMAGSNFGDGFVAIIVKVIIKGIRNVSISPLVSTRDELIIIAKLPPTNAARRELIGMAAFEREVYAYNVVIPAFVKFQNDKGINQSSSLDGFFEFPKCYYARYDKENDETIVIMEDIRQYGFTMENKQKPVGLKHAEKMMETLGRLHALSFAMKDQSAQLFTELCNELNDIMMAKMDNDVSKKMFGVHLDKAIQSLTATNDIDDESSLVRKLREFEPCILEESKRCVNATLAEPYAVIGHGDSWINNVMFKYEKDDPKHICLLDWQLCRYASPVLDIMYFIFLCTDEQLRDKQFDTLLQIYYKSLRAFLQRLGSDANKLFPYTALIKQLKMFGKFGFIMSLIIIPMLCSDAKDLPNMDDMAEDFIKGAGDVDDEVQMVFKVTADSENAYNIRMSGIVRDAIQMGII